MVAFLTGRVPDFELDSFASYGDGLCKEGSYLRCEEVLQTVPALFVPPIVFSLLSKNLPFTKRRTRLCLQ